ncbi:MAG: penicillin-binding protein 1C [Gemmatimonadales bacterium]|nr:penicillin-binding protein 1C [Gemmatimonadales bacterium]
MTLLGGLWLAVWILQPLPHGLLDSSPAPGLLLQDRRGGELRTTRSNDGSRRRWVSLTEMDPDLIAAFLATEDRRFYRHHGVDLRAAVRALATNQRAGRVVSGGSTITMQVARMLRPAARDWGGKLRQVTWALRLERHLDKHAILEQYLNRVPLGQGAIGVEAAAALYFAASAGDLSAGQAALLAGVARAPSSDNPLVSGSRASRRRSQALGRLAALGFVSPATAARAADEPVLARERSSPFLAPHFTTRVIAWIEGAGGSAGTWRTSLDFGLQAELEREVRHTVEMLNARGVRHGAVVVLDNPTGEILAWIGSPDFWADTAGQVDMVVSPRQPGSALKPFLYALAFDRGRTAASILPDIARVYQTATGPYSPRNYDRRFHGPVRAREALASSYNLPAVELASLLGAGSVLQVLRGAGFTSLGRSAEFYGLGLALGNGDVTLLELANGYRSLVNGGEWRPYRWRASAPGEPVEPGRRFASAGSAALVLDILADPLARIPGFGLETPLDFPFPVAAKTGTSRHFTDNWAVGATGRFTVAVWVGNFSGRPMEGVSGVSGAGPLLHRSVLATARHYPPGTLPTPELARAAPTTICRLSGLRATAACPRTAEWFLPGSAPEHSCHWHRDGKTVLPVEYAEWAQQNGQEGLTSGGLRRDATARAAPDRFHLVSPKDGDVYRMPPGADGRYVTLALRAAGPRAEGVRWFVDGEIYREGRWRLRQGVHRIRGVSTGGEVAEATVRVE